MNYFGAILIASFAAAQVNNIEPKEVYDVQVLERNVETASGQPQASAYIARRLIGQLDLTTEEVYAALIETYEFETTVSEPFAGDDTVQAYFCDNQQCWICEHKVDVVRMWSDIRPAGGYDTTRTLFGQGRALALESTWIASTGQVDVRESCVNNPYSTCAISAGTVDVEGKNLKVYTVHEDELQQSVVNVPQQEVDFYLAAGEGIVEENAFIVETAEPNWEAGLYYYQDPNADRTAAQVAAQAEEGAPAPVEEPVVEPTPADTNTNPDNGAAVEEPEVTPTPEPTDNTQTPEPTQPAQQETSNNQNQNQNGGGTVTESTQQPTQEQSPPVEPTTTQDQASGDEKVTGSALHIENYTINEGELEDDWWSGSSFLLGLLLGVATNGIFPMYQICKEKRSNESIQVQQGVVDVEARVEDVDNENAGEPAEVVQQ